MPVGFDSAEGAVAPERAWRDLNYDVAWEAGCSGVIRCRAVHNRRHDIFRAADGINLRAVHCQSSKTNAFELLREKQVLRHVEVRLPGLFGPERLYLAARLSRDGAAMGTISAIDPQGDEVFRGQLALLSHVAEARAREEDYRNEAEIMLEGLRVLLSPATAAQKLEDLAALAVRALRGGAHAVLEIRRDGSVYRLMRGKATGSDRVLAMLCREQKVPVLVHGEGGAHTTDLRMLLGKERGDVALMLLPIASENVALVCAPQRDGGFRAEDIGFASRFALILQQALVLKDEQDKLIQAARLSALGRMSASLAHELRQPLNTISMAAQNLELMAEAGPVAPDTLSAKVLRIQEQVERASRIMDRIRRFSRKGTEAFVLVDMAQLVEGVRLLMEHDLTAAGIGLRIDVADGLTLRCDSIQIEQVLTNLIRNAMDVLMGIGTAERTSDGVVTVRGTETESGIALRVEDNGPGFPGDVASRPLETFYTSKSAEAGTGLGLSICHMIAREHAGCLEIGNHADGAFVELRLPRRNGA